MVYTFLYVRQDGEDWVITEDADSSVLGRYLTRAQALDGARRYAQTRCPCHIRVTDSDPEYSEIWESDGSVPFNDKS